VPCFPSNATSNFFAQAAPTVNEGGGWAASLAAVASLRWGPRLGSTHPSDLEEAELTR